MVFLRDSRMSPDCGNVQVSNLYMKSMGSICQVGVLPLEQGLKPGASVKASWKVGSEIRSFTVKVTDLKTADADNDQVRLWRHARSWLQDKVLLALR